MNFLRAINKSSNQEKNVYSPISGKISPLSSLKDGVFSEGLLGEGCVIDPIETIIYAPFNGTVVMTVNSGHAIGLMSSDGIELLIHVGLETINMNGRGFNYFVKQGDSIEKGQKLMTFSKEEIHNAGYNSGVIIIISNSKKFKQIRKTSNDVIQTEENLFNVI